MHYYKNSFDLMGPLNGLITHTQGYMDCTLRTTTILDDPTGKNLDKLTNYPKCLNL